MADSNRKSTRRKLGRRARRAGPRQEASKTAQTASSTQAQPGRARPPKEPKSNGAAKARDGAEVSSLLASSVQEVQELRKAADDASAKIREAAQTEASKDGDDGGSGGDEVSSLLTRTSEEVKQVLEAADEAAEKIRAEAREDARRFLEESRRRVELVTRYQIDQVSAFTEQALAEAAAAQQQLEALRKSFEEATADLDSRLDAEKAEIERPRRERPKTDAEDLTATLRRRLGRRRPRKFIAPHNEPAGDISEGAKLLALRHVMEGEDSKTIEARLRDELGVKDPASILEWMGKQKSDR